MRSVPLPGGRALPALGLGTWRMGEHARTRAAETDAVLAALVLGYRLVDTAEMYGEGGAERIVGAALAQALRDRVLTRDDLFIVSKVYPHHAGRRDAIDACARSLDRLGVDRIDLYLLHWRGATPLAETVDAFETLKADGRIDDWGVSNFDVDDLEELMRVDGGAACATNQVYYSAAERGIEYALLPHQRTLRMPVMAYSPVDQGALANDAAFARIGARRGATAAQVALAWVLRSPDVIAIPKAVRNAHLHENLAAAMLQLDEQDLREIDAHHPPPTRKRPLATT